MLDDDEEEDKNGERVSDGKIAYLKITFAKKPEALDIAHIGYQKPGIKIIRKKFLVRLTNF